MQRLPGGQRGSAAARRAGAAAVRGGGAPGAAGRLPVPAGGGPRAAAGLLRVVRLGRVLLDPVPAPPFGAALHARTGRHPRGHRPRQPDRRAGLRGLVPPGGRGGRQDRHRHRAALLVARVLVLDGVRRCPGGRGAEGLRRGHPLVGGGDVELLLGRRQAGRLPVHGARRVRHNPLPAGPLLLGLASGAGGQPRQLLLLLRRLDACRPATGELKRVLRPAGRCPPGSGRLLAEPGGGALEQVLAHRHRLVEGLAEQLLACQHPRQGHLLACDDRDAPLRRVGGRRVAVDRRGLEGQLDAADAGEVDGQAQQVGPLRQRWERPGEGEREAELVGRVVAVVEVDHHVLEGEQHPRVDLQGEVEVQRAVAGVLGVQVHLPRLAQRVGLHEVALVVHVEAVVHGVVLELGNVPGDVDDRHAKTLLRGGSVPSLACPEPPPSSSRSSTKPRRRSAPPSTGSTTGARPEPGPASTEATSSPIGRRCRCSTRRALVWCRRNRAATPWTGRWSSSWTPSTGPPTPGAACPGGRPASAPSTVTARWPRSSPTRPPAPASRRSGGEDRAATGRRCRPAPAASCPRRSWPSPATRAGASAGTSTGRWGRPPSIFARSPAGSWTLSSTARRTPSPRGTTWGRCWCAPRRAPLSSTPTGGTLWHPPCPGRLTPGRLPAGGPW